MINYLFYKTYRFQKRFGIKESPVFLAAWLLGLAFVLYSVDILFFLGLVFDIKVTWFSNELNAAIATAIIIGAVLLYLYVNKRYASIIESYEGEGHRRQTPGNTWAILFYAASFFFFVLFMAISYVLNNIAAGNF